MERIYELSFQVEADGRVDEGALRAEIGDGSDIHRVITERLGPIIDGPFRVRGGRLAVPDGRPATRRLGRRDRRVA